MFDKPKIKKSPVKKVRQSLDAGLDKKFPYPVYFSSENYHIIDRHKDEKASLEVIPNRPADFYNGSFVNETKSQ